MFKRPAINAVSLILALQVYAQTPAPSAPPTAAGSAASVKSPAPSASPTTDQMIDSLGAADLGSALSLLKSNFTNPDAITETELNRATLTGLMVRMPGGLMLLPNRENTAAASATPIYSEIFENHIGYLRLGDLSAANLKELDKKLQEFRQKKVDAVVVDLRASNTGDFATAADVAKRFCPKGKTLFSVRKPASKQDRQFTSDREPAFQGLIVVLADADTAGSAEALAATLKLNNKALIIGESTSGRAVEYSDQPLPSGKILRVASAEAVMPEGQPLFPGGVKPDLPVEMPLADKHQIFRQSAEKGMGPFVYETDRPHLNEAALMAGTNPELDISDAQRRLRPRSGQPMRDPVLQRALDVVTSLEIYQKR